MRSVQQEMFHNGNRIEIEAGFYFLHSFIELYSYIKTIYMANDKLFNISNSYMLHCGFDSMDGLMERREEPDRRYLANSTARSQFFQIHISYFLQNCKKRQISLERFDLMIYENTKCLELFRALINSR